MILFVDGSNSLSFGETGNLGSALSSIVLRDEMRKATHWSHLSKKILIGNAEEGSFRGSRANCRHYYLTGTMEETHSKVGPPFCF